RLEARARLDLGEQRLGAFGRTDDDQPEGDLRGGGRLRMDHRHGAHHRDSHRRYYPTYAPELICTADHFLPRMIAVSAELKPPLYRRSMVSKAGLITAFLMALAVPALAQQSPDGAAGAAVFKRACANCHNETQKDAPGPAIPRQMTAESIFNALTLGRMQIQAISLSDAEQRAVAVFASG